MSLLRMVKKQKIFGVRQTVENPEKVRLFYDQLCADIPPNKKVLEQRKYAFSKTEGIETILNRDILAVIKPHEKIPALLERLLQKRSVRTISGVTPIGILTKPYPCPGRCVYCPTEDRMPKSYIATQPAAARALRNKFHPYAQVNSRMMALKESGHPISKLEIIVMGGTWSFLPHAYQHWYIRRCFEAANNFPSAKREKLAGVQSMGVVQSQNETAEHRIIGLTLETRPDFITEKELKRMREYGCTRIEIGVQTLDDDVQKLTKRGHFRTHVVKAMKLMKDYGFKVCFHLMPGLPGSTIERDLVWMREVFENPDFCPDFVKIYPCVVIETAELKKWWDEGKYKPLNDQDLVRLLVQFQTFVPEWVRVMRLMRDIPLSNIVDGARFSNLRQILNDQPKKLKEVVGDEFYQSHKLAEKGYACRDIRFREIGFSDFAEREKSIEPVLVRRDYKASDGLETFLSFESPDKKHLFALLRLRKPSDTKPQFFRSVLCDAALIREVHSYGTEISVGEGEGVAQHRGFGKRLIQEAERIARDEWHMKRVTIIAGVGTREYYRKWGYELKQTYMTKQIPR